MAKRCVTTMRLTEEAVGMLRSLSQHYGISHTAIVELAIREKALKTAHEKASPLPASSIPLRAPVTS